jgi:sialic acid synthase SpsE
MSSVAAIAAVALSAKIIEKHITLDKNSSGPDHFYAVEPNEFRKYVRDIREAEKILGKKSIVINPKVKDQARRKSIFVSKNVNKNEIITKKNLIIMDNARGVETRYMMSLLGFKFNNKIKKNSPLDWKYINFKK